MKIQIINGPNLNLLGVREKSIYGNQSFESYFDELKAKYPSLGLFYYQSNVEGEIINKIHEVGFDFDAIIINAGGYTHSSVAIADAVSAVSAYAIEVHISNVHAREEFRHKSLLSPVCMGVISGFGLDVYRLAIESIVGSSK